MSKISRRDFVVSSAVAGIAAAAPSTGKAQAPAVRTSASSPAVISSANGLTRKNGGDISCVETAFEMMVKGEDVLDALIAGVNIVELDPEDTSVGYGGLPNADGVVQLDSCCMHGPKKQAGGVARRQKWRAQSWITPITTCSSARALRTSRATSASRSRTT
jgi:N4-(beta-N-acetylglucosaminyl)-L-asparaginase